MPIIHKNISRLAKKAIIIAAIGMAINITAVQAEPYLRVCKNGVIYYYFDNRGSKISSPYHSRTIRTVRPQLRQRLSVQELEPLIEEASQSHKLPSSLIKAVIRVESNFHPDATSPKGAQGLMQLMPGTAEDLQVANPYDIRENIWGGTRYLGMLLQKFNYKLHLALAAYNAGPQRVEKCQDVPAIEETQNFVRDVCANFLQYSDQVTPPKR